MFVERLLFILLPYIDKNKRAKSISLVKNMTYFDIYFIMILFMSPINISSFSIS